jgi:hypothetical protein
MLFVIVPGYVLARLAYNFFYEHPWLGRPPLGLDYLVQAALWTIVWGLLLRGLLAARLRRGLRRDIDRLVASLTPAHTLGPLFDEWVSRAAAIRQQLDALGPIREQAMRLRTELESEGDWKLGRLEV